MPRLMDTDDDTMQQHRMAGNFAFSGRRLDQLGATEYTLATIAVDETGSTNGFEAVFQQMLATAVLSCKKSPRSDNLLLRVVYFSTKYPDGVKEIHGFRPLAEIDPVSYPTLVGGGMTPLCDVAYSMIGAMNQYGEELAGQDFSTNAIGFVISDGCDNKSTATMTMVKAEQERGVSGEHLESMISILVGINTAPKGDLVTARQIKQELDTFHRDAGMTQFIDAGDATPAKLAKLAAFIDQSISSQSQALGTGGPSQNIAATI